MSGCRECQWVATTSSRKCESLRKTVAHRNKLALVYTGKTKALTSFTVHPIALRHISIYTAPLTFLLSLPSLSSFHSPHSPHSHLHQPISSNAASITAAPLSMVAMRMSCPGQSTKETCRSSLKCPPQPVLSQGKESGVELPHDR